MRTYAAQVALLTALATVLTAAPAPGPLAAGQQRELALFHHGSVKQGVNAHDKFNLVKATLTLAKQPQ